MRLISFIFFAYYLSENFVVRSDASGYYWKDYYGEIPDDAFPGGTDINGGPIYIGQSYAGKNLIPSKIYGSNKKNYYELGGREHETIHQVKILCTQHPEQMEWILTDNEKIKDQNRTQFILGGYEPGWTIYIGRVRSNGEIMVGKVIADNPSNFAGFWGSAYGKSVHITKFEILSFNRCAPVLPPCIYSNKRVFKRCRGLST